MEKLQETHESKDKCGLCDKEEKTDVELWVGKLDNVISFGSRRYNIPEEDICGTYLSC